MNKGVTFGAGLGIGTSLMYLFFICSEPGCDSVGLALTATMAEWVKEEKEK